MMILRTAPASPFGRKVKIVADLLGFTDKIELVICDTGDPVDPVRKDNPLGKIPTLITEDGAAIYDSGVIVEYLDLRAGGGCIVPVDIEERIAALTLMSLGDGICDAALLIVYESRYRPADKFVQSWIDHQQGKIDRALDYLEHKLPKLGIGIHAGEVAVACALGYLDLRLGGRWRDTHLHLVAWLTSFEEQVPMYGKTRVK